MKTELKTIGDVCATRKSQLVDWYEDPMIINSEAYLLYGEDSNLVGWISFEDSGDYVDLYFLEVFPEYKGKGYSLELLSLMPKKSVHLFPLDLESSLYFTHISYTGRLQNVVFED